MQQLIESASFFFEFTQEKMPEVPVWVQEYMLTSLEAQLENEQYMYAAVSARNLVELAVQDPESLNPQIIDAATRVQHTLENKGYTEDVFMDRLVHVMQTDKGEARRKFQSLDDEIKRVYNLLPTHSTAQDKFGRRFGVLGNPYKNDVVKNNMPKHTWRFLTVYLEFVAAMIIEHYIPNKPSPMETATLLGLPVTLYEILLNRVFNNEVERLVNWVVAHDWVRWWLASYANRVITQFVFYWLKLPNSGDWSNALGENLIGQPPLSLFQTSYWGPIALARVIQNGFTQITTNTQHWRLSMTLFGDENLVPAYFFVTSFSQMVASSDFVAEATLTVKNILDRENTSPPVMPTASTLKLLTVDLLQQVCRSVQRQITQDPPLLGAYKYVTENNLCQEMDNLVSQ